MLTTPSDQVLRTLKPTLVNADALDCYPRWPTPQCIIADGPYGLGKFPGEPITAEELPEWYAPHIAAWARHSHPSTTLWFWNREVAWALIHPILVAHGWVYEETVVWDKGVAHVAGNCNSKTIRGLPVVTEIAVRYSRRIDLPMEGGVVLPVKHWLRQEWLRSGLPMNQSNQACGVKNAATRKYLTQCHLWYFPPGEAVVALAKWCHKHGLKSDRPYFSIDGTTPISAGVWDGLRSKWRHEHGVTNVWSESALLDDERLRDGDGVIAHANQKPLDFMGRMVRYSTDQGDVVWEPFGGLCSATVAATILGRKAYASEINRDYHHLARARIAGIRETRQQHVA